MHFFTSKASPLVTGFAASLLLLGSHAALAQTVNLTAAPTEHHVPDGQNVPMWGFQCADAGTGATCAAANPAVKWPSATVTAWSPVVITVPYAGATTSLTINLTNSLFVSTSARRPTPTLSATSLVIVGQLGGGLGGGKFGDSRCHPRRA